MMRISVLINSYNYGQYVVEAVESALNQTQPPFEVIVVDDGSTDGTLETLNLRYADHPIVRVLYQRNGGQLSAFVLGMENALGDVLCFLDADDKYQREHLQHVGKAFSDHRSVDFVFTAHELFGDAAEIIRYAPQDTDLGFSLVATLKGRIFVGSITSAITMRRSLALTLLPTLQQAAPQWRVRADDCLIYGASIAGSRKYFLSEPTVLYRIHGNNNFLNKRESEAEQFAHGFRRDSYFGLLSSHLGIGPSVRLRPLLEFRSIHRPTARQYKEYCRLLWRSKESLTHRIRSRIRMMQYYRQHQANWS